MLTIEENGVNHEDEHFVAAPTSDIMKQELKVESIEIDQYDDDKGSVAAVHGGMDSEPGLRLFETLLRSVENKNLNSEAYRAFFRAYSLLLPGVLELEKTWWHVSKSYEKVACNREIYLLQHHPYYWSFVVKVDDFLESYIKRIIHGLLDDGLLDSFSHNEIRLWFGLILRRILVRLSFTRTIKLNLAQPIQPGEEVMYLNDLFLFLRLVTHEMMEIGQNGWNTKCHHVPPRLRHPSAQLYSFPEILQFPSTSSFANF